MTKLEILEECLKHWQYMVDKKCFSKYEYFNNICSGENIPLGGCYACEYVVNKSGPRTTVTQLYCNLCPLDGYAWNFNNAKNTINRIHCPCIDDPKSIYANWNVSKRVDDRVKYAKEMVDVIKKAIDDIER